MNYFVEMKRELACVCHITTLCSALMSMSIDFKSMALIVDD